MNFLSSNIKKCQETETPKKFPYILGSGNPKKASYILGNVTFQSIPRKFLIFQATETPQKLFIFQETEAPEKFLYFRERNFLMLQETELSHTSETEICYILKKVYS